MQTGAMANENKDKMNEEKAIPDAKEDRFTQKETTDDNRPTGRQHYSCF